MKRVLFVDDEQNVLDGLKRMLYPMRNEWSMDFVTSGRQALKLLSEYEVYLLITDLRMAEMSGIELLSEVLKRHPQVVRMVLSGTVDQQTTLRSTVLAHQYLVKPCDAATLRATMERALTLRVMLDDPALKQLISKLQTLPSVPAQYVRLMDLLRSGDASSKEIGDVIRQDMSMTAKVLQLVNSSFFGIRRRITDPREAVAYLGQDTVRDLAAVASMFSAFRPKKMHNFSIDSLQDHSLAVATLARRIGDSLRLSKTASEHAYVGALLHDIGKLVLACNYPEKYDAAVRRWRPSAAAIPKWGRTSSGCGRSPILLRRLSCGIMTFLPARARR